jgi:hypothetical protein
MGSNTTEGKSDLGLLILARLEDKTRVSLPRRHTKLDPRGTPGKFPEVLGDPLYKLFMIDRSGGRDDGASGMIAPT